MLSGGEEWRSLLKELLDNANQRKRKKVLGMGCGVGRREDRQMERYLGCVSVRIVSVCPGVFLGWPLQAWGKLWLLSMKRRGFNYADGVPRNQR